jgi:hypothetical protein
MYCPNCGTQLSYGTRFCSSCGTPIKESSDKASTPISADLRKLVFADLAETHIHAVENAQITKQERVEISKSVLAGVNGATTYGELISFLLQLSSQWTVYRNVYEKYQRTLMRN